MLINLPPRRVMAKASPTFGVSETTRFGGCIIPSDLKVATRKCGYCTGMGMITGLMARFTAFFNCWQQWASGGDGIPKFDRAVDQCSSTMRALLRHEKGRP